MFQIASNNEEEVVVTVTPTTSTGAPTQIDGPLTVTVVSGNATVVQDPDRPNEFIARSADNDAGETVYQVEGDADMGDGVITISDQVVYTVTQAQAQGFGFAAAARPKTPEPTPN